MTRRIAQTKPGRDGKGGKRSKKGNPASSPSDCGVQQFGWMPVDLLDALVEAKLSRNAFRILIRIWREHLSQGGVANGELICPYTDFMQSNVPRSCISSGLKELETAGIIRRRLRGRIAGQPRPTHYRLTWLGAWSADGESMIPPSNEWKSLLVSQ